MKSVMLVCACASVVACAKGDPLTAAALTAAKSRWQAAKVTSYDLEIEISGDLVQEGDFLVAVRDGQVTAVTRNGEAISNHDVFYTVPGMHEFLGTELEMAENPARYWNAPPGTRIYQRTHFDPELGYARRYLRAVTGTQHNIVIETKLTQK